MSTTLTIRNLALPVKQRLRVFAANHGRSMEAEAREILTKAMAEAEHDSLELAKEMQRRIAAVRGTWKKPSGEKSTDDIMRELRNDE
jgi:plasmid stability protein